jgi:NAD(P)-dependent dehydrogenase (short-subunit alcohol dehydrogenase family)
MDERTIDAGEGAGREALLGLGYEDLTGAKVLAVGGSSGMGRRAAEAAASLGAVVYIGGRDEERLRGAASEIPGAEVVRVDAADDASLTAALDQVRPDHVTISIGEAYYRGLLEIDSESAMESIRGRFMPPVLVAQWAARNPGALRSLTVVGGIVLRKPVKGATLWSFAAPGIVGLIEALALEIAPTRVNSVAPGYVADSPMNRRLLGDDAVDGMESELGGQLPAGRFVAVADVARQITALISDPAVTGTTRVVDSGHSLV